MIGIVSRLWVDCRAAGNIRGSEEVNPERVVYLPSTGVSVKKKATLSDHQLYGESLRSFWVILWPHRPPSITMLEIGRHFRRVLHRPGDSDQHIRNTGTLMDRRFKKPVSDGLAFPLIDGNQNNCRLTKLYDTYRVQPVDRPWNVPQIHSRGSHFLTTKCRAPRIGTHHGFASDIRMTSILS